MFVRCVLRVGLRIPAIAIEVHVIRRRLERIVEMAGPVPGMITILHRHMTHLHRKERLQHRLPHFMVVDLRDGSRTPGVAWSAYRTR